MLLSDESFVMKKQVQTFSDQQKKINDLFIINFFDQVKRMFIR